LVGFDALAFATTTPSAASAPRSRIEPQTIPISLIVFDRPPEEDEELSLDEELSFEEDGGAADSAGAELPGAGVFCGNVVPPPLPPTAGFIGSAGAIGAGPGLDIPGGGALPGLNGGADGKLGIAGGLGMLGIPPNPPPLNSGVNPLENGALHFGQRRTVGLIGPVPRTCRQPEQYHSVVVPPPKPPGPGIPLIPPPKPLIPLTPWIPPGMPVIP
jgi:hypothetical protein